MTTIIDGSAGITYPNSTVQASAGVVLQVVNATYSTTLATTLTSYVDTGLTATITPKFSTSKILVLVSQQGVYATAVANGVGLQLVRNSTGINIFTVAQSYIAGGATTGAMTGASTSYLDSPATTSATTYKTQVKSLTSSLQAVVQNNGDNSTITLMEIAG